VSNCSLPPVITLDSHSESYRERFVQQSPLDLQQRPGQHVLRQGNTCNATGNGREAIKAALIKI
jgi:hypothetical protein